MDDSSLVRRLERVGQSAAILERLARRDAAFQRDAERFAVEQFHHGEGDTLLVAKIVNRDDVGVRERGDGTCLPLETRASFRIVGDVLRERLQGNPAAKSSVLGDEHLAHAATIKRTEHTVVSERGTNQKGLDKALSIASTASTSTAYCQRAKAGHSRCRSRECVASDRKWTIPEPRATLTGNYVKPIIRING